MAKRVINSIKLSDETSKEKSKKSRTSLIVTESTSQQNSASSLLEGQRAYNSADLRIVETNAFINIPETTEWVEGNSTWLRLRVPIASVKMKILNYCQACLLKTPKP